MSEEIKPGDIVNVTIEGVRVAERDEHGCVTVYAEAHDGGPALWPMPPQAAVERCDPEWWPPRPADVLRHTKTGRLWFGVAHASNLCLYSSNADCMNPQQSWGQRHLLTLVHREDEQGATS